MSKQLFKSTVIVSSMTLLSRILGFVRDLLIARIFGVDGMTDAFFVAFKIPNLLRRLFAEGAFAQAFMPVLADYQAQSNPLVLKGFIDKTFGTLALVLFVLTVIGVVAAPLLILVFAPGFVWQSPQHLLATDMLRLTFPYVLFISLVAFASSVLNLHHKFAVPAITPVLLNLCMISAAIWLSPLLSQPILALAGAVLVAGIMQLLFQFSALQRLHLVPRFKVDFKDAGVQQVMHLMLPALFATSLVQINLLLNTLLASLLVKGSVSWLYYADRLVEFPLGIFGIAVATVILPNLASNYATQNTKAFSNALDWGLRLVLLIAVPAAIGLFLLAEPLLSTLFQAGKFDRHAVQMTGQSLQAYAVGLVGFILVKVLVPGYTSRKDMKTPMRFSIYAMLANIGLNLLLVIPLNHVGLALATSLGAYVNALCLVVGLLKTQVYQPRPGWKVFLFQLVIANSLMASGLHFGVDKTLWYSWASSAKVLHLGGVILGAVLLYGFSLFLVGVKPKQFLIHKEVNEG